MKVINIIFLKSTLQEFQAFNAGPLSSPLGPVASTVCDGASVSSVGSTVSSPPGSDTLSVVSAQRRLSHETLGVGAIPRRRLVSG